MKKETKYYTPDISEICVGFEVGWRYYDKNHYSTWDEPTPCSVDMVQDIMCMLELRQSDRDYFTKRIRVKYLDQEDILSLGWSIVETSSMDIIFEKTALDGKRWGLTCGGYDSDYIDIFVAEDLPSVGSEQRFRFGLFKVKLKNKFELKKLMEQLGIV